MAITLTSDEYDEIRLLIGGDIDDEDLSDGTDQRRHGARCCRIVCAAADTGRSEWVEHCGDESLSPSGGCIGARGFWYRRSLSR